MAYLDDGETVEAVCIQPDDNDNKTAVMPVAWADAIPLLSTFGMDTCAKDRDWDIRYFYVWTNTRIIFVQGYDSSVGLSWLPRNPQQVSVDYVGGGC